MQLSSPSVVYKTVQLYCIFIKINSVADLHIEPNLAKSDMARDIYFPLESFSLFRLCGIFKNGKISIISLPPYFCIFIKVSLIWPLIFIFPFTPHRERLYWKISTPGPQHWLTKHTLLFLYLIRSVCQTQIQILVKI